MRIRVRKFTIEFCTNEVDLSLPINISEKEFNRQLNFLRAQTKGEHEFSVEEKFYDREQTGLKIKQYFFTCGNSDTILTELNCKEGYCFSTKERK